MELPKNPPLPAFSVLAKPIGPICNLDCSYCFYLEKELLYPGNDDFKMSTDVLENFIRQKIEGHQVPQVSFAWQGGEPTLLGIDFFKRVVQLQKRYADGKIIENGFQTNGVLLDDEWCHFLKSNNFLVGLSIDGPLECHDHHRVFKGGQPSFEKVIAGIEMMKKHSVEFNTLTVIQKHNSQKPLEVYRFLKEIGSGFMQFIPIVEHMIPTQPNGNHELATSYEESHVAVTDWSVDAKQFGVFLCTIFDEWVRNDVGEYFVQMFDETLAAWAGILSSVCIFRPECGGALAIEHNGDLYSCDHYVYPDNLLGNIEDDPLVAMLNSAQQVQFGRHKLVTLPQYCLDCEVRFACNGECPKNRFNKTPTGDDGLNYLCAGYKQFFTYVGPYMRTMLDQLKQQKAPANVMPWARGRKRRYSAQ
jgi:uncharacterized protein|tara:strand:- start:227 stop:1477 length:1251 start_codon:yes stop_codon:yes gene_type:complete